MASPAAHDEPVPKTLVVSRKDLPLSCPMPEHTLWNAHPKVYLPIEATGKAVCPYCSNTYILQEEVSSS